MSPDDKTTRTKKKSSNQLNEQMKSTSSLLWLKIGTCYVLRISHVHVRGKSPRAFDNGKSKACDVPDGAFGLSLYRIAVPHDLEGETARLKSRRGSDKPGTWRFGSRTRVRPDRLHDSARFDVGQHSSWLAGRTLS